MTASRGTRYFLRGHCLSDVILILEPPAGNSVESSQEFPMEHIRCVSQFLAGEYQISSRFYNTWEKTARLLPKDIDEIKKLPGDWALVQFVIEK